ncbi:MAG: hypothetical protein A2Z24_02960 [Candidatus Woykebacteria bacterium RBG_16_44_10]|uniref:Uncharacterized protein n=1 Tax=Candidatus Woykebacteria bacterium RBG_16_44_10 TaxID=1802597 RepID=A0A1G1WCL0_9BACT|nr:MAG: hypothetical protein A2Z24_02960 [Candidatus Woykebacteria bacterium RBG_16_44_10]
MLVKFSKERREMKTRNVERLNHRLGIGLLLLTPEARAAARLVKLPGNQRKIKIELRPGGVLVMKGGGEQKLNRLGSLICQRAAGIPVVYCLAAMKVAKNGSPLAVVVVGVLRCPECSYLSGIMVRSGEYFDTLCLECGHEGQQRWFQQR